MVDHHSVQMEKTNPPPHVVHLPVQVIRTSVFQLDRRLNLDNTVETALIVMGILVGAATVDSVWRRGGSVTVYHAVQMDQMNPLKLAVHLTAPVIQTFVFQLDRRLYLDKTVETALIVGGILVGAATVDRVC